MIKKILKRVLLRFLKTSKRVLTHVITNLKNEWPLFATAFVLTLLLARDPFSDRTLIPNFEPFPDTFHYITTARCYITRGEWKLCRDGIQYELPGTVPSVPQAYSLALIPGFLVLNDPRFFYYTNVALSFIAIILFDSILKTLTKRKLLRATILAILVTSYHVYWLPSLAMAENLLIPLYLLATWLLTKKVSRKQLVGLSIAATGIYFTKYAYTPLTASIMLFGGITILVHTWNAQSLGKTLKSTLGLLPYLVGPAVILLPFSHNFSSSFSFLISQLRISKPAETAAASNSSYFSAKTSAAYLPEYFQVLLGKTARFLWDFRPWYPKWIGYLGLGGWIAGLIQKKHRLLAGFLLVSTATQLAFMSTFYAFDTRYIFSAFFAVLLGVALFVEPLLDHKTVTKLLTKIKLPVWVGTVAVVGVLGVIVLLPRATAVKSQIVINIKYAETPWWYLSVLEYNSFFANKREEQPQLITLSSPYLVDFFSNNTYAVLPFDEQQDFANVKDAVWGIENNTLLMDTYQQKLENGETLYVADYGIQATDRFRSTFAAYQERFTLTKVNSGCHDLCNIYSLELPVKRQ